MIRTLKFHNLVTTFLLFLLVIFIQLIIIKPSFYFGLSRTDWVFTHYYQSLGDYPFFKVIVAWKLYGAHSTYRVFSAGILYQLFGTNYFAIHLAIGFCKVLASFSLFFVILTLFKNRLLAFLTTVIYSMSFSNLETIKYTTGLGDYLAVLFMNLFLIHYYITINSFTISRNRLIISGLLLFTSFILVPIRIYPIFSTIPFIELLRRHKNPLKLNFSSICQRFPLSLILLLLFLCSLLLSGTIKIAFQELTILFKISIMERNLHMLTAPISTLGAMIFPEKLWVIFPRVYFKDFWEYLYIFVLPTTILLLFPTVLFSTFLNKRVRFISGVTLINIFFFLVLFPLITYHLFSTGYQKIDFDFNAVTGGTIMGVFSLSLALNLLKIYFSDKKDLISLAAFSGLFFAIIFILFTWFFARYFLPVWGIDGILGLHGYLMIPAMGTSLFIAAILIYIHQGLVKLLNNRLKFALLIPSIILLLLFNLNLGLSREFFSYEYEFGMLAKDQERAYQMLIEKTGNLNSKKKIFYFDTSDPKVNYKPFSTTLLGEFYAWILVRGNLRLANCNFPESIVSNIDKLKEKATVLNNVQGFLWDNQCGQKEFLSINDLYAFKIENDLLVDIKDQVIEEIFKNPKKLN